MFAKFGKLHDESSPQRALSNTGKNLHEMVQVVLMAQGQDIDNATASKLISQATVRRDVAIRLIQAVKDRELASRVDLARAQDREGRFTTTIWILRLLGSRASKASRSVPGRLTSIAARFGSAFLGGYSEFTFSTAELASQLSVCAFK